MRRGDLVTVARKRADATIGRLDDATMLNVNRSLAAFVGIAWLKCHGPPRFAASPPSLAQTPPLE